MAITQHSPTGYPARITNDTTSEESYYLDDTTQKLSEFSTIKNEYFIIVDETAQDVPTIESNTSGIHAIISKLS